MSAKLRPLFVSIFGLSYAGAAAALFIPGADLLPLYALFSAFVIGIQICGYPPAAFIMTGLATALGVFCMSRLKDVDVVFLPLLILSLWGGVFLVHTHMQKILARSRRRDDEVDEIGKQTKIISGEIAFYEERKKALAARGAQRRQLSIAARELGSALDPMTIQTRLIETAQHLFPGRPVRVSNGQQMDAVESWIVQRRQPLLIPNETFKGEPQIAVPVFMQKEVAAILRVGGSAAAPYTRDDLRLVDILAGLASMALDNTALFNQVQETALRDGLTGLLTIRAFQEQLQTAILEASRYNQPVSVILSDVDHFKSVNDTYGHQAGDQILQGFAHVLDRNVRPVDIVARYGGEEFIVLLLQTPHEEAVQIAEHIRQDLAAQVFDLPSKQLAITSSFGVATFPEDATSGQQLVRQADQRLYKAKQLGRNRVQGK